VQQEQPQLVPQLHLLQLQPPFSVSAAISIPPALLQIKIK
jgi:hypothetical protein